MAREACGVHEVKCQLVKLAGLSGCRLCPVALSVQIVHSAQQVGTASRLLLQCTFLHFNDAVVSLSES